MKKVLSLLMSMILVFTAVFAMPASAQTEASYENSIISSNINKIKKYIRDNGFINGNGNYTLQETFDSESYKYYDLFIVDSSYDELIFSQQVYYKEDDSLLEVINLGIEQPTTAVMYAGANFWISGDEYSDLNGHAFIDRNFNHNVDYANFYVDSNTTSVDDSTAFKLFDDLICSGFEDWNYMLGLYFDMNMGAVGFKNYCTVHSNKTITTKATLSSNGKKVSACSICGRVASSSAISKITSIKLSATAFTYDGKVKTPKVTVKDSKGKAIAASNYTVTYASGRKNVGKYAVKITFKGNYSGTKTLYFTIKPKNTSISSITAGSKKFTVKLKKYTTQTTGYQIQYATNAKFTSAKTVTIGNKTTSKTVNKLTGNKKYYVRVRTYKTVGGTKYYSDWSKAKTVTTKR